MKPSELSGEKGTATPFSFADMEKECERILEAARQKAHRTLEEAESQAAVMKAKALKDGSEEGYRLGREKGMAEGRSQAFEQAKAEFGAAAKKLLESLEGVLKGVEAQKRRTEERARTDLIALSVAIAERIVKREIERDKRITALNVQKAIELSSKKSDLVVRVHPDDLEEMRRFAPELHGLFPSLAHVEIVADGRIMRGGAVVTNPEGAVDADIRTQIEEISRELLGEK